MSDLYVIMSLANDIVLLAPSTKNLQGLINVVAEWCMKWNMHLNLEKTNVVHFCKNMRSKARSTFVSPLKGVRLVIHHSINTLA